MRERDPLGYELANLGLTVEREFPELEVPGKIRTSCSGSSWPQVSSIRAIARLRFRLE